MLIGIKDIAKLFAISVVTCCAAFVSALFLNYNIDILGIKDEITSPQGLVMYDAQVATGKVVSGIAGGCLIATTVVLLIFYVKNYIDSHGKELGILKALGYSEINIAVRLGIRHKRVCRRGYRVCCRFGLYADFLRRTEQYGAFPADAAEISSSSCALHNSFTNGIFYAFGSALLFFQAKKSCTRLASGNAECENQSKQKRQGGFPIFDRLKKEYFKKQKNTCVFRWIFGVLLFRNDPDVHVYVRTCKQEHVLYDNFHRTYFDVHDAADVPYKRSKIKYKNHFDDEGFRLLAKGMQRLYPRRIPSRFVCGLCYRHSVSVSASQNYGERCFCRP